MGMKVQLPSITSLLVVYAQEGHLEWTRYRPRPVFPTVKHMLYGKKKKLSTSKSNFKEHNLNQN